MGWREFTWPFSKTRRRRPSAACIVRTITWKTRRLPGEVHLRHHISPNGYYRGKKIVKTKSDD